MVDFKKLGASKAKPKALNPRDIFNALPKPSGINDLYASQAEVLEQWFSRRNERDVVVKLHTGGGKTLVALLMAQSIMNETSEPVLYLAPNNQLVKQVLGMSDAYGISAVAYTRGEELPGAFFDGKSVLVGAYEALFNGRSKFGIRGSSQGPVKVGAVILDDAHVALSSVRDAFTLTIQASKHQDVYRHLVEKFRASFKEVGRVGTYDDVTEGKDFGVLEVPSWAWVQKVDETQQFLAPRVDSISAYVWPFLRDLLPVCHCFVSKSSVSITPILPAVDLLPTYADAPRRIYMSATIADDSEIVRTFDASRESVAKPITSASLAGVGERMILVPALMKLGATPILTAVKQIATRVADSKRGVAILSPSKVFAKQWEDVAEVPDPGAVLSAIEKMQAGTSFGPLALANRYDGVDLAGNACRLLVIDDLPQGASNYDMYRATVVADAAVNSLLAQRIEQGLGRGTRGGADYCVVILVGAKLVGWIGRKKNVDFLTASTRVQLRLGQEVSAEVGSSAELLDTINKCLLRDKDWVAYHASELSDAAQSSPPDVLALRIASAERRVFGLQRLGQFQKARTTLEELLDDTQLKEDAKRRAWLSCLGARIAYQNGDADLGHKLQTHAFALNNSHTPPRVRPSYQPRQLPGSQSGAIVDRLLEYQHRTAITADFDEATSGLVSHASASRYEESLAELGAYLGFESERPDAVHEVGPDVLWRTDAGFDFVIEAKNKKKEGNPLYKKDHAQLLEAEQWFKQSYPGRRAVRVSALHDAIADPKATPAGTLALRVDDALRLAGALRALLSDLANADGDQAQLREICEAALRSSSLTPDALLKEFMRPFEEAKPTAPAS